MGIIGALLSIGVIAILAFLLFVMIVLVTVAPLLLLIIVPIFWYVLRPLFQRRKTALDN